MNLSPGSYGTFPIWKFLLRSSLLDPSHHVMGSPTHKEKCSSWHDSLSSAKSSNPRSGARYEWFRHSGNESQLLELPEVWIVCRHSNLSNLDLRHFGDTSYPHCALFELLTHRICEHNEIIILFHYTLRWFLMHK